MLKILNSALNGTAILVESDGLYYQVNLFWPGNENLAGMSPSEGTQMVFPYEPTEHASSEEIAWKWGPWSEGISFDAELPPPPEIVTAVKRAFSDYQTGLKRSIY